MLMYSFLSRGNSLTAHARRMIKSQMEFMPQIIDQYYKVAIRLRCRTDTNSQLPLRPATPLRVLHPHPFIFMILSPQIFIQKLSFASDNLHFFREIPTVFINQMPVEQELCIFVSFD